MRTASIERKTSETQIRADLSLDGGERRIDTPNGFFSHMLDALTRHGGLGLDLVARGDVEIDLHHTVEDTGIVLGDALAETLGDRAGVRRFAHAFAPLDEALARAVVDLSGRGSFHFRLPPELEQAWVTTEFPLTLVGDFFGALADRGRLTLHLDVLCGRNPHHVAEAAFKAVALGLAGRGVAPGRSGRRCAEHEGEPYRMNGAVAATVIDAGVGNIGNLVRALRHLGAEVEITCDPATIRASRCLVLPGVGAFRPPREVLRGAPEEAIRSAVDAGATLLGICIGYQLLFDSSEEFGTTDGLGLLGGPGHRAARRGALAAHRLEPRLRGQGPPADGGHDERRPLLLRPLLRAPGRAGGVGTRALPARPQFPGDHRSRADRRHPVPPREERRRGPAAAEQLPGLGRRPGL